MIENRVLVAIGRKNTTGSIEDFSWLIVGTCRSGEWDSFVLDFERKGRSYKSNLRAMAHEDDRYSERG